MTFVGGGGGVIKQRSVHECDCAECVHRIKICAYHYTEKHTAYTFSSAQLP